MMATTRNPITLSPQRITIFNGRRWPEPKRSEFIITCVTVIMLLVNIYQNKRNWSGIHIQ